MDWVELDREMYDALLRKKYRYYIREYTGDLKGTRIFRVHFYKTEREAFIRQTELRITNSDCWKQRISMDAIEMFLGMDRCRFFVNPEVISDESNR